MRPPRVLICGSHYGQFYFRAVTMIPGLYEVTGLLARGSDRSRDLADRYQVPLYQVIDAVPEVDVACSALPSGEPLVFDLLDRGIHVLAEHPQTSDFLAEGKRRAEAADRRLHWNTHFDRLDAPQRFLRRAKELGRPRLVILTISDRALFASLDILRQALGKLDARVSSSNRGPGFSQLQGIVGECPMVATIQKSVQADGTETPDGSAEYDVSMRISLSYGAGVLTLGSSAGPVVWNRNQNAPGDLEAELWQIEGDPASFTGLLQQRDEANLRALKDLMDCARGADAPSTQAWEHGMDVAASWERIGEVLA